MNFLPVATSLFTQIPYGIEAVNAHVTVGNCRFWNLRGRAPLDRGTGIKAAGGSVITSLVAGSPTVWISQDLVGIEGIGTSLDIREGLFFVDGTHGIKSSGNVNTTTISILNNQFLLFQSGMMSNAESKLIETVVPASKLV